MANDPDWQRDDDDDDRPAPRDRGPRREPHRGVIVLVMGILGFAVCGIFGIVAWVMGSGDLKKMDAGQMDPEGRGLTQAGKIIGMITTILMVIGVIIGGIAFIFMFVLAANAPAPGPQPVNNQFQPAPVKKVNR
jgi:flagellar basal body-associated protein FliL